MTALLACLLIVHDGDTLRCNAERIRLVGIDAPELEGSSRCNRPATGKNPPWCDHAAAERSRDALSRFVARGAPVVARCGVDRYGRTLARVTVNGRDAGAYLVGLGLARWWVGATGC